MKPAIYEVVIAHRRWGPNYDCKRVLARDALAAIAKAKLRKGEIAEEVRVLARVK